MNKIKKLLCLVLSLVFILSLFTVTASADVGDYEFSERESNNTMSLADRIYNDYTVSGVVSGSDMDFFKFVLSSRSTVQIITMADYKSCFLAGIFNTSEEAVAASTFVEYSSSGYPTYLTSVTLNAGTYYYVVFNKDASTLRNDYMFYITYTSSSHTHSYSNSCDTTCNSCGATRSITHTYSYICDSSCNVCGYTRSASHSYTNNCDNSCNYCGRTRNVSHSYDDECDSTCNNCSQNRTVPHVYTNDCDSICDKCGKGRNPAQHRYSNPADASCNECGYKRTVSKEPILFKESNGEWHYYENGKKSTSTKLIKYSGKWFYIENGEWKASDKIVKYEGKYFYISNGKWKSNINRLVEYNGKQFLIEKGKWSNKKNTVYKYNGTYYYVVGGKVSTTTTGIKKIGSSTFYIKKGILQTKVTNVIKSGKKWYYVKKGKVQTKTTGIVTVGSVKYYIKKGILQTGISGLKKIGSNTYYMDSGRVISAANGIIKINGKRYYIKSGKVQKSFKGFVYDNNRWYHVKNGIVDNKGNIKEHEFVNSYCVKCKERIVIPFKVTYPKTLYYHDTKFKIASYDVRDANRIEEGYAKIYVSVKNITGGYCFADIIFYDKNGYVIDTSIVSGSKRSGGIEVSYRYIPAGTAKIEIVSSD